MNSQKKSQQNPQQNSQQINKGYHKETRQKKYKTLGKNYKI